ncbi:FO synthase [Desulfitobacterium sp. AusDCA]|uniref:FO synthase n=1 Tax=Desulfitobacterium sp. AusDCA TaxID=3240383 RepID=UPI003DA6FF1D
MLPLFAQSELKDLIERVEQRTRLDFEAGVRMMQSKDILALGYMANLIRERKHGNKTYFAVLPESNRPQDHEFQKIIAHNQAIASNATYIYGQHEKAEDKVNHLLQFRELQDKNGSFLSFSPLPFLSNEIKVEGNMGLEGTTGFEDLRMLAVSRILLDNIDHIKAFWLFLGPKLAQVSLSFGVDDLDGQVVEDHASALAEKEQVMTKKSLIKMIHKARRQAIERDSLYQMITDYGREGGLSE